jgi:hypothetical protein
VFQRKSNEKFNINKKEEFIMKKKEKFAMKRTTVRRRDRYNSLSDAEKTSVENGVIPRDEGVLSYLEMKERYEKWFER